MTGAVAGLAETFMPAFASTPATSAFDNYRVAGALYYFNFHCHLKSFAFLPVPF